MPFDGTSYSRIDAIGRFDQAIGLLAREDRWAKRVLETSDGRRCIMGALRTANAQMFEPFVADAIEEMTGRRLKVVTFNDRCTTTHAMVMHVMQRARQLIAETEPATLARVMAPPKLRLHRPWRMLWS